ncbi:hypothetical protein FB451DRAFT_1419062 [Mycena latifolia]|nr:hypothetical protein FB451DRAFT_1419062 [Mycena latifolia]
MTSPRQTRAGAAKVAAATAAAAAPPVNTRSRKAKNDASKPSNASNPTASKTKKHKAKKPEEASERPVSPAPLLAPAPPKPASIAAPPASKPKEKSKEAAAAPSSQESPLRNEEIAANMTASERRRGSTDDDDDDMDLIPPGGVWGSLRPGRKAQASDDENDDSGKPEDDRSEQSEDDDENDASGKPADAADRLSDDSQSNYSTTDAAERKEADRVNHLTRSLRSVPETRPIEEQDDADRLVFEAEAEDELARKGKGKGKAKRKEQGHGEGDEGAEGQGGTSKEKKKRRRSKQDDGNPDERAGDAGDDDPLVQEEDPSDQPPWELTSGPMSKKDLEEALAARRQYHAMIETVARRSGKRMGAVFKAVGDGATSMRHTNPWNAFQTKYRAENPKDKDETSDEYKNKMKAAYADLFADLPEEDRRNPDARRKCVDEVMEWYHEKTMLLLDDRKAQGNGHALMSKIVKPFIHQSTVAGSTYDVEVFGFGIDPFSDVAIIWGGTPNFQAVYQDFEQPIKAKLTELKAIVTNMKRRDGQVMNHRRLQIDFSKKSTEANMRDSKRRIIKDCLYNDILNALAERAELDPDQACTPPSKMSWKWSDLALKYTLRLEGWPAALKNAFPSAGFTLNQIKGKAPIEALTEMALQMEKRYLSADNTGDGPIIVSWTDDERDCEATEHLTDIPIVVADDDTVLLRANSSKSLMRTIDEENQKQAKQTASKKRKATSAPEERSSKKSKRGAEMPPSPARTPTPVAGAGVATTSAVPARYSWRYVSSAEPPEVSETWVALGVQRYEGPPTKAHNAVECWQGSAWRGLPAGFEMIEDPDFAAESALVRSWFDLDEDED